MPFTITSTTQRSFCPDEDRFLLCLTHMYGYGAWDLIRKAVRSCERFRFDYFLQSCNEENLARRCDALMKAAQREVVELDAKKAAFDMLSIGDGDDESSIDIDPTTGFSTVSGTCLTDAVNTLQWSDLNIDRLVCLTLENRLGGSQLALARAKQNKQNNESVTVHNEDGMAVETAAQMAIRLAQQSNNSSISQGSRQSAAAKQQASARQFAKQVPEGILPGLAKLLVHSASMGISGIVAQFITKQPTLSKRQIELKIAEIAVKEKHDGDNTKVWHLRPPYAYLLRQDDFDEKDKKSAALQLQKGKGVGGGEVTVQTNASSSSIGVAGTSSTTDSIAGNSNNNSHASSLQDMSPNDPPLRPRPRSPYQIFCIEKFEEAKSRSKSLEDIKELFIRTWDTMAESGQAQYIALSAEEHARYNSTGNSNVDEMSPSCISITMNVSSAVVGVEHEQEQKISVASSSTSEYISSESYNAMAMDATTSVTTTGTGTGTGSTDIKMEQSQR